MRVTQVTIARVVRLRWYHVQKVLGAQLLNCRRLHVLDSALLVWGHCKVNSHYEVITLVLFSKLRRADHSSITRHLFSGNYCPRGSAAMVPCPAGTWGSTTGLHTATCSGPCSAGSVKIFGVVYLHNCFRFYMPHYFSQVTIARQEAAPRPHTHALPGIRFCVVLLCWLYAEAFAYIFVVRFIFGLTDRTVRLVLGFPTLASRVLYCLNIQIVVVWSEWFQLLISDHIVNFYENGCLFGCISGNYCPIGSFEMVQCPIGTWGSATGLQLATCSGQCTAGIVVWSYFPIISRFYLFSRWFHALQIDNRFYTWLVSACHQHSLILTFSRQQVVTAR